MDLFKILMASILLCASMTAPISVAWGKSLKLTGDPVLLDSTLDVDLKVDFDGIFEYAKPGEGSNNNWKKFMSSASLTYSEAANEVARATLSKAFKRGFISPEDYGSEPVPPHGVLKISLEKLQYAIRHEALPSQTEINGKKIPHNIWTTTVTIGLHYQYIDSNGEVILSRTAVRTGSGKGSIISSLTILLPSESDYEDVVDDALGEAVEAAVLEACLQIVQEIRSAVELRPLVRAQAEQKSSPAELSVGLSYSDKDGLVPNQSIDAAESSRITAVVSNKGKGTAYEVNLEIDSDFKGIQFGRSIMVGDIHPGDKRTVNVDLSADAGVAEGTATFRISAREKRKFDSQPYRLEIPVNSLQKPVLEITNTRIYDGSSGVSKGDGDGVPENGETVELEVYLRNSGVGECVGVTVELVSARDVEIVTGTVDVGRILPGQTSRGNVAVSIPRTFSGSDISLEVNARDARGVTRTSKTVSLPMSVKRPDLAFSYRILDSTGDGCFQSGEGGDLEITLSNRGGMDASEVDLVLSSGSLELVKTGEQITRIPAGASWQPIRFGVSAARTMSRDEARVDLKLTQKDFAGLTDQIIIPIKRALPILETEFRLADQGRDNGLQAGEKADIVFTVRNTGLLEAQDVTVSLLYDEKKLRADGPMRREVGHLAAGATTRPLAFPVQALRRSPGATEVHAVVEQKDFPSQKMPFTLDILAESEAVVVVAGDERPKTVVAHALPYSSMAPVIAIGSPSTDKVASASVVLSGTVVDEQGVTSLDIRVNGVSLTPGRDVRPVVDTQQERGRRNFRHEVPLQPGKNTISVEATDSDGLSARQEIVITRLVESGETYAVVIGIDQYLKVPKLEFARNDASTFADYLKSNLGLDSEHLITLFDDQASVANLRTALGTTLPRKANKPEDTVLIFFAGHGAPDPDRSSQDPDGVTKYLLPFDADPTNLYGTALPMDELAAIFRKLPANRVILFSDSCYSGSAGGRTILASGTRAATLSDAFLDRIVQSKGRVVLTSSGTNEVSQEDAKLRHGVFTYYLLKGLQGAADVDDDKIIDLDELSLYVRREVRKATEGRQNPVRKGEEEGQVIVGRVR